MARYEYDLIVIGAGTAGLVTAAGARRAHELGLHQMEPSFDFPIVRRTAGAYYREKLFAGRLPRLLKHLFDFLR